MSKMRLVLLVGLAMLLTAGMAAAVNVTFQVDMSVQQQLEIFDPATDDVGVLGDFNGWNGTDDWGIMSDDNEDLIYEVTYDIEAETTVGYKFTIYPDGLTGDDTDWEDIDNRSLTVPTEDITLDVVFFNNQETANPVMDFEMVFQVDMGVAITAGTFDPQNDGVIIRGNHAAIGNWGGFTYLQREGTSDIWSAFIQMEAVQTNTPLEWKFVIDQTNNEADPVIWEELPEGGNRSYTPTGSEPDDNNNGYLDVLHELVYWANNPGGIENDLTLVFYLDGRPAIRKHEDVGIPGVTAETIDWFIITGPWDGTGWEWTPNDYGNINLLDDGVAPDQVAGDSIFTATHTMPAGTAINFTYKYGANGGDNEAGIGANHFVELDDSNPTMIIEDEFGSIGTLYDDYLFVRQMPVTTLPTEFEIGQNYPNPFNPTTSFSFTLPAPGDAKVRVFNVAGQQVISRDMGMLNAGKYEVTIDGSELASGVYFYRVEANGLAATKKMMLMK